MTAGAGVQSVRREIDGWAPKLPGMVPQKHRKAALGIVAVID
jgi:hypothetical protein